MKMFTYLFALVLITASCGDDDDTSTTDTNTSTPPNIVGMNFAKSERTFDETYEAVRAALAANENIAIVAEVDHRANAASVNLELNPTRVIFFGNPRLGTPLMNANQQAGLDLPQRMLVYQDDNDDVYIGYNNTEFLSLRHALDGASEPLAQITAALATLAGNASDSAVVNATSSTVNISEGVETALSQRIFVETYDALRAAIDGNPNLRIVAELDHKANATSVDLDLPPTRVIIFGNPNLGTPLMQSAQTTALDLPQKMLVWQNDLGVVQVSYNAPDFLVGRHGIAGSEDVITTISGALQNLSNAATGN